MMSKQYPSNQNRCIAFHGNFQLTRGEYRRSRAEEAHSGQNQNQCRRVKNDLNSGRHGFITNKGVKKTPRERVIVEKPGTVPERIGKTGNKVGLNQEAGSLTGHGCGQKENQATCCSKEQACRNSQKSCIKAISNERPGDKSNSTPANNTGKALLTASQETIEEEHCLGPLAEDCKSDHECQRRNFPPA